MDLFGIPGDVFMQGGAIGIVTAAVLSMFRGWLVPKTSLDAVLTVQEKRLDGERVRGDEWKATAAFERARNEELSRQLNDLLEVGRTTQALIEGLNRAGRRHP